ncbi:hypothetical protein [Caldivirga sp.]|uniref:hypothetical protein n=1 Tax=Caldivirga sp. TaxID=2080243 RepID=UPI0025B9D970|nr:hypothetical protein [Caldivirga sp.]
MQLEAVVLVAYLTVASIITYLLLNRLLWRGERDWVFIGVGYMILALILQYPAQQAPFIVLLLSHLRSITDLSSIISSVVKPNIYLISIYMGSLAGIFQETARYFAVKDRAMEASLYVGYGFALIDIAVAVMGSLATLIIPNNLNITITTMGVISLVGLLLQPLVSFLFHPGASMMLRSMQANGHGLRGLIAVTTAHAYMDSFLEYLDLAIVFGVITSYGDVLKLSLVYFISITIIPALIFSYGLRALRKLTFTSNAP